MEVGSGADAGAGRGVVVRGGLRKLRVSRRGAGVCGQVASERVDVVRVRVGGG